MLIKSSFWLSTFTTFQLSNTWKAMHQMFARSSNKQGPADFIPVHYTHEPTLHLPTTTRHWTIST
jgi:hypothetical protein